MTAPTVTRAELEQAFEQYQATVRRAYDERDWSLFAGLFTADAEYHEHSYGDFRGREEITAWAVRTMATFPGSAMVSFPVGWAVFDVERAWVVCEIQNVMPDPGDGSYHQAPNLTVLHYAGNGEWSYEEDVYNPMRFLQMVAGWARIAQAHGRLPEGGRPGWPPTVRSPAEPESESESASGRSTSATARAARVPGAPSR